MKTSKIQVKLLVAILIGMFIFNGSKALAINVSPNTGSVCSPTSNSSSLNLNTDCRNNPSFGQITANFSLKKLTDLNFRIDFFPSLNSTNNLNNQAPVAEAQIEIFQSSVSGSPVLVETIVASIVPPKNGNKILLDEIGNGSSVPFGTKRVNSITGFDRTLGAADYFVVITILDLNNLNNTGNFDIKPHEFQISIEEIVGANQTPSFDLLPRRAIKAKAGQNVVFNFNGVDLDNAVDLKIDTSKIPQRSILDLKDLGLIDRVTKEFSFDFTPDLSLAGSTVDIELELSDGNTVVRSTVSIVVEAASIGGGTTSSSNQAPNFDLLPRRSIKVQVGQSAAFKFNGVDLDNAVDLKIDTGKIPQGSVLNLKDLGLIDKITKEFSFDFTPDKSLAGTTIDIDLELSDGIDIVKTTVSIVVEAINTGTGSGTGSSTGGSTGGNSSGSSTGGSTGGNSSGSSTGGSTGGGGSGSGTGGSSGGSGSGSDGTPTPNPNPTPTPTTPSPEVIEVTLDKTSDTSGQATIEVNKDDSGVTTLNEGEEVVYVIKANKRFFKFNKFKKTGIAKIGANGSVMIPSIKYKVKASKEARAQRLLDNGNLKLLTVVIKEKNKTTVKKRGKIKRVRKVIATKKVFL